MTPEELAKLCREDYEKQEKVSTDLRAQMQFLIPIGIALGAASIALLDFPHVRTWPWGIQAMVICLFGLVWLGIVLFGAHMIRAIKVRKYAVPKAVDEFLVWRNNRKKQIMAEGFEAAPAGWYADRDMLEFLADEYARTSGENRAVNLQRQEQIALSVRYLISAAVALVLLAICYSALRLSEVPNARATTQPTTTRA